MKFSQVIEYNKRNIFLENSYTKFSGETILRSFSKNPKLSISLDQQSKVLYRLFLLYTKLRNIEISQNILKLSCRPLAFALYIKLFFLKKELRNQSLFFVFCMTFEEKHFPRYTLLLDQISLSDCLNFVRYWTIYVLSLPVNHVMTS